MEELHESYSGNSTSFSSNHNLISSPFTLNVRLLSPDNKEGHLVLMCASSISVIIYVNEN